MNRNQMEQAKQALIEWLSSPEELGNAPGRIECVNEFDLHDLHYYVFRFKKGIFGDWLVGVSGGYEEGSLEHSGHVYSLMRVYHEKTAVDECIQMVEAICNYWKKEARKQLVQEAFEKNLKYISQTELPIEVIEKQFVKDEHHFYLTIGNIECPSGEILVADPLAYLPSKRYSPKLEITIPSGNYPVEVSLYRNSDIGIRMCTTRLKINNSKAVRYVCAMPTADTAVATGKEGVLSGFPVDAGMMTICDAKLAEEYQQFIDEWYKEHPDKNHYDDYFAKYFAKSYERFPSYQREGGDFILWEHPVTNHHFVMVASGFGDGFYQSYYGYDEHNEITEILVPMINPELFEHL